jgi:hypothetical protein
MMNVDRLTKRQAFTVGGVIYAKCEHCQDKRPECFGEQCPVPDEALISLAAYEDTGLSPADIADLTARAERAKAERDKAAEFIRWVDDNFSHYMPQEYTDRLMALAGEVATGKEETD